MSADLPRAICSRCGRKSWSNGHGEICGMPQPGGGSCDGLFAINDRVERMPEGLEPGGGNLYRPHTLQIDSGTFWRCKHGRTGLGNHGAWIGCDDCARADPDAFARWHGTVTPVAQFQVRLKRSDFWINCPTESQYNETIATGLYVGRKLYEHA